MLLDAIATLARLSRYGLRQKSFFLFRTAPRHSTSVHNKNEMTKECEWSQPNERNAKMGEGLKTFARTTARTTEAVAFCFNNEKRFDKLKRQYSNTHTRNTPRRQQYGILAYVSIVHQISAIGRRHRRRCHIEKNVWIYLYLHIHLSCLPWSERKQRSMSSHMFYIYNMRELKWKSESEKLNGGFGR